jgi:hypothetical protein
MMMGSEMIPAVREDSRLRRHWHAASAT